MDINLEPYHDEIDAIISKCLPGKCEVEPLNMVINEVLEFSAELSQELKDLETRASKLTLDCKAAKDKLAATEKERLKVQMDLAKLKEDNTFLTMICQEYETDIQEFENEISHNLRRAGLNMKEKEIIIKTEKELRAYAAVTGIRWYFQSDDGMKEGLVTNSKKNFVKAFSLESSLPSEQLSDTLWSYIKEAASESWDDLDENEENSNQNK